MKFDGNSKKCCSKVLEVTPREFTPTGEGPIIYNWFLGPRSAPKGLPER